MTVNAPSKVVFFSGQVNSIHQCLMALGAERDNVYVGGKYRTRIGSIYNRYTIEELYEMVENLFKESIKKYHIDLHFNSGEREFYEEKTKLINEAHQRALKILKGRTTVFHR